MAAVAQLRARTSAAAAPSGSTSPPPTRDCDRGARLLVHLGHGSDAATYQRTPADTGGATDQAGTRRASRPAGDARGADDRSAQSLRGRARASATDAIPSSGALWSRMAVKSRPRSARSIRKQSRSTPSKNERTVRPTKPRPRPRSWWCRGALFAGGSAAPPCARRGARAGSRRGSTPARSATGACFRESQRDGGERGPRRARRSSGQAGVPRPAATTRPPSTLAPAARRYPSRGKRARRARGRSVAYRLGPVTPSARGVAGTLERRFHGLHVAPERVAGVEQIGQELHRDRALCGLRAEALPILLQALRRLHEPLLRALHVRRRTTSGPSVAPSGCP